ncbi:hypothetical protein [Rhizobium bangladeshense]|uniref:hypothetical protein n=1 Tax=Rhizobium bangladeshense TaxID=1138189 RepID=UPI001C8FF0C5|nr:hypothetical protein [Rhizobium bangladeshense]MBY3595995.1 hypothetical protein [Rhizobium bangladeshense]
MSLMPKMVCSLVFATALSFFETAAAQNLDPNGGTLDVANTPVMTNGKLTGCQLTFDAVIRDYTYRQGAFIAVSGGVGLMFTQQTIGTTVKIVVTALDPSGRPIPSPPSRAYLIGANYATTLDSLVAASASDQPSGLFSIFKAEPTISIVLDALKTKRLVFAFNQNNSGTDIQLPVELDIVNTAADGAQTRSDNMIKGYAKCVLTLINK